MKDHQRTGRYRITTAAENQNLINCAEAHPFETAVAIRDELHMDASSVTIRRRLHEGGIHHRNPTIKKKLNERHREGRLPFAQRYIGEGLDFWSSYIY